jgi:hypothetical protein
MCCVICGGFCYNRYFYSTHTDLGYGDNYAPRRDLFTSASFGALSKIVDKPTEIIITMNLAQIPLGAASTASILLL